jgi:hypothetical protein
MNIIIAGRQTSRIWVLLEHLSNQCFHITLGLGPQLQKSFVNSFPYHVGQAEPALAKRARLTETLGIEPDVNQTRTH